MTQNDQATVVVARFRNRDDAHRAVIELREVEFSANAIGAAFLEGPSQTEAHTTLLASAPAVDDRPAHDSTEHSIEPRSAQPPDTPMTTRTGGSPFGEASTYRTQPDDWWEGMRVALPHPSSKTQIAAAPRPARTVAAPTDTNYEPADRPAPAYDNDYDAGDYAYEGHNLEATLVAAGLVPDRANSLAHTLEPGEALVTVSSADRAAEAESILQRNNGNTREQKLSISAVAITVSSEQTAPASESARTKPRLHLFGEILRHHNRRG